MLLDPSSSTHRPNEEKNRKIIKIGITSEFHKHLLAPIGECNSVRQTTQTDGRELDEKWPKNNGKQPAQKAGSLSCKKENQCHRTA